MAKQNEKEDKKDIIIKIILIIIIILLLIHNCTLIRKNGSTNNNGGNDNPRVPGGNVQIIELLPERITDPINGNDNPSDNPNGNKNGGNKGNSSSGNNEEPNDSVLSVYDKEHSRYTWNGSSDLAIFTNPVYEFDGVVAPETSNTYQFIVKNSTSVNVRYSIDFTESNPYNINLKYKLKKNDKYIIDNYISYEGLNLIAQELSANKNDTYYLEWKWISTEHDTEAGYNQAPYKLTINIKAEETNG